MCGPGIAHPRLAMVPQRLRRALPPLLLGLALAQCGKDGAGPGSLRPAAIVLLSGNGQTGTVGQNLSQPLVVQVTTSDGRGVPNVTVSWSVTAGGGSLTAASTQTDPTGVASVVWSLGTTAGSGNQTARASVVGVNGVITFTASAVAAAASQIALVSGNNQADTVGRALPQQLSVRVSDPFNNPVSGRTVTWTAASGGGTLSSPTTSTDAQGQAFVSWTLGPAAGAQTAAATVSGLSGSPVLFTAQAAAGAATQLVFVSGNNQTGTVNQALGAPLVVTARDAFGNAKSGVTVLWAVTAGGGSVSLASVPTDAQGQAAVTWTLGITAGSAQTATATSASLSGSPVVFAASAVAAAATQLAACGGDAQTGVVGSALAQPLAACVTDAFGNPVAGVTVAWTVSSGGATLASPTSPTDATGRATNTVTLGPTAGTVAVAATVSGLAGSPLTFTETATPAAAAALVLVSGDGQSGTAGASLASAFVVRAVDVYGNPVAGTSVVWAVTVGGGSVAPAAATTDAAGLVAATLTLGPSVGTDNNHATASSGGLSGSPVTFTASAAAAAASQLVLVSGDRQTATVGTELPSPFVVKVTDAFGNPIPAVAVSWAVTGGGGSIFPATSSTNLAGLATATLTLGTGSGTDNNTVTGAVGGLGGSPLTFTARATQDTAAQLALGTGEGQSGAVGLGLAQPLVVVEIGRASCRERV